MNKTCELKKLIKDIVREVLKEIKEEEDKRNKRGDGEELWWNRLKI
jgi:hypothetical protein